MIILFRKEKFGSSSEKTPKSEIDGQLSIFNKAELEDTSKHEEPIVQKADGYYRNPTRTKRAELIKNLSVREIPCDILEEDMFCNQCGSGLKLIGYEKVCEELEYIPAKLQIVRYIKRLELEKLVLGAFWCWLDFVQMLKGSALGKAVTCARNQKPYMKKYLLDVRIGFLQILRKEQLSVVLYTASLRQRKQMAQGICNR